MKSDFACMVACRVGVVRQVKLRKIYSRNYTLLLVIINSMQSTYSVYIPEKQRIGRLISGKCSFLSDLEVDMKKAPSEPKNLEDEKDINNILNN